VFLIIKSVFLVHVICTTINPDWGNNNVRWLFKDKSWGKRFALTGDWTPVSQSTASCHGHELQLPHLIISVKIDCCAKAWLKIPLNMLFKIFKFNQVVNSNYKNGPCNLYYWKVLILTILQFLLNFVWKQKLFLIQLLKSLVNLFLYDGALKNINIKNTQIHVFVSIFTNLW